MSYGNKSIADYCHEAYQTGIDHGWYESGLPNVGERLMLIVTELSEAMEFYRDGRNISEKIIDINGWTSIPAELFRREDGKPDGFWAEIADVMIRCFDIAGAYAVDIESIIKEKMKFNTNRPYKHGKIV